MDQSEIEAKIVEIVAKQLAVPKEKVTRTARFQEDLGADSLDVVEIVMELEDAFNIEIPDAMSEKIKTVGDVIDFVEKAPKKA